MAQEDVQVDASALQLLQHSPRTWISVSVMSSTASGWTWEESRTNTPPLDFTAMKYVSQRLYSLDASLHRGTASSTTGRDVLYSGTGTCRRQCRGSQHSQLVP